MVTLVRIASLLRAKYFLHLLLEDFVVPVHLIHRLSQFVQVSEENASMALEGSP